VTPQTDVIEALIEILRGDADLEAATDGRIFGGFVGLKRQAELPGPTIQIQYSGGSPLGGYARLQRPRVDITFYGRTPQEADWLRRAAHPVLKDLQRRTAKGVLIHGIEDAGGYAQGREQDTNWPYIFTTWNVLANEV